MQKFTTMILSYVSPSLISFIYIYYTFKLMAAYIYNSAALFRSKRLQLRDCARLITSLQWTASSQAPTLRSGTVIPWSSLFQTVLSIMSRCTGTYIFYKNIYLWLKNMYFLSKLKVILDDKLVWYFFFQAWNTSDKNCMGWWSWVCDSVSG